MYSFTRLELTVAGINSCNSLPEQFRSVPLLPILIRDKVRVILNRQLSRTQVSGPGNPPVFFWLTARAIFKRPRNPEVLANILSGRVL